MISITDLHALVQPARAIQDEPPSGDLVGLRLIAANKATALQARAYIQQRLTPHVTVDPPRKGRNAWLVYGVIVLPRREP